MSKGGKQTATQTPDSGTQSWIDQVRQAATQASGSAGPNVAPTQGYYGSAMGAGNLGMSALSGNQGAISSLMNPYTNDVMNAQNAQWDTINKQTANQVNSNATLNGAFGGSRAAITQGTALSQNNQAQAAQDAQLLSSGYNGAMSQAGTLANLGMGAAGQSAGLSLSTDPQIRQMQLLSMGNGLGGGSTTTQTQKNGSSPLSGAMGGAQIGSMFGPWGTGIGAVAGGLLGMF